ncbi:uncharacterized protein ASCRUDRAFT_75122 [Ascoidea rubescens DSM 1968]|uniref:Uncharacterized protein n=1 Tax=Ascoidea rubescens DSM 1968 TaxID=1344418 RepID=A0A1D2VJS8_9ASCO|nr:hypothetical protein ASCRUDRAFT_75122 [Ascoidea rubescens DSM 1968]ODV61853.1 hypothetical protein ASCRUDRAFT_75122 [Ascoidea rubescens DSM 1968]
MLSILIPTDKVNKTNTDDNSTDDNNNGNNQILNQLLTNLFPYSLKSILFNSLSLIPFLTNLNSFLEYFISNHNNTKLKFKKDKIGKFSHKIENLNLNFNTTNNSTDKKPKKNGNNEFSNQNLFNNDQIADETNPKKTNVLNSQLLDYLIELINIFDKTQINNEFITIFSINALNSNSNSSLLSILENLLTILSFFENKSLLNVSNSSLNILILRSLHYSIESISINLIQNSELLKNSNSKIKPLISNYLDKYHSFESGNSVYTNLLQSKILQFKVLFEVIDQNYTLNFKSMFANNNFVNNDYEINLINLLNISLIKINDFLTPSFDGYKIGNNDEGKDENKLEDFEDPFIKLHLIFSQFGSTLSLISIFVYIIYILAREVLNDLNYLRKLPSFFQENIMDLSIIPPVSRLNFIYPKKSLNNSILNDYENTDDLFDNDEIVKLQTYKKIYDCLELSLLILYKLLGNLTEKKNWVNFNGIYNRKCFNTSVEIQSKLTTLKSSVGSLPKDTNFLNHPIAFGEVIGALPGSNALGLENSAENIEILNSLFYKSFDEFLKLNFTSCFTVLMISDECNLKSINYDNLCSIFEKTLFQDISPPESASSSINVNSNPNQSVVATATANNGVINVNQSKFNSIFFDLSSFNFIYNNLVFKIIEKLIQIDNNDIKFSKDNASFDLQNDNNFNLFSLIKFILNISMMDLSFVKISIILLNHLIFHNIPNQKEVDEDIKNCDMRNKSSNEDLSEFRHAILADDSISDMLWKFVSSWDTKNLSIFEKLREFLSSKYKDLKIQQKAEIEKFESQNGNQPYRITLEQLQKYINISDLFARSDRKTSFNDTMEFSGIGNTPNEINSNFHSNSTSWGGVSNSSGDVIQLKAQLINEGLLGQNQNQNQNNYNYQNSGSSFDDEKGKDLHDANHTDNQNQFNYSFTSNNNSQNDSPNSMNFSNMSFSSVNNSLFAPYNGNIMDKNMKINNILGGSNINSIDNINKSYKQDKKSNNDYGKNKKNNNFFNSGGMKNSNGMNFQSRYSNNNTSSTNLNNSNRAKSIHVDQFGK